MHRKILAVGENVVTFSCVLRISVIGICVAAKSCIFVQKPTHDKKDNAEKNILSTFTSKQPVFMV